MGIEITLANRQNAVGSVPKAKILEIPRNLYIFEIEAVAVQNMVAFASAGPREGLLYIGVEINPSPREEGKGGHQYNALNHLSPEGWWDSMHSIVPP